jgi:hypothetical protein
MEINKMEKEIELLNELLIVRSIKYLAKYFEKEFCDPESEEDRNLDKYEYATSAMESLIKSVETRAEKKSFEYLTGAKDHETFVKILEEESWIDVIVDEFESR